jgi:hypothetical protein
MIDMNCASTKRVTNLNSFYISVKLYRSSIMLLLHHSVFLYKLLTIKYILPIDFQEYMALNSVLKFITFSRDTETELNLFS